MPGWIAAGFFGVTGPCRWGFELFLFNPVSYTHLDVYKRQVKGSLQAVEKAALANRLVEESGVAGVAPHRVGDMDKIEVIVHRRQRSPGSVSYTHLI